VTKQYWKSYIRKYRDLPLSSYPFSSNTRIPDCDKQLEAENKLRDQEHEEKMGQIDINKLEAASPDPYVRRARPTTLWICNFALAYVFLVHPLACWAAAIWRPGLTPPGLPDAEYLFIVLGALLGFGGFRSWEKWKGVSR
jgi:hypothetical protein